MSHVHAFFMHTYLNFITFIYWIFFVLFCLSPSLSFFQSASRHLYLILLPLIFSSMMRKVVRTSRRTFPDEAFIRNAKSFYWTSPKLTYPLSSTIKVGSHCVASQSLVLPWSYRSFTPICTDSILLYLIFLSRSRYAHCSHSWYCIWGTTCS